MQNGYTLVSGIFFGIVAVLQAVRALNQWSIQVESIPVPVAVFVAGGMCARAFASRRQSRHNMHRFPRNNALRMCKPGSEPGSLK